MIKDKSLLGFSVLTGEPFSATPKGNSESIFQMKRSEGYSFLTKW